MEAERLWPLRMILLRALSGKTGDVQTISRSCVKVEKGYKNGSKSWKRRRIG
jgi:hypothetical protein